MVRHGAAGSELALSLNAADADRTYEAPPWVLVVEDFWT